MWSEDAGACQFDGGDPSVTANPAPAAKINRGNCGPGFISKGGQCISQATGKAAPPPPKQTNQQKLQIEINKNVEKLNAIVNKCPKGQVWTKGEGCHEDD